MRSPRTPHLKIAAAWLTAALALGGCGAASDIATGPGASTPPQASQAQRELGELTVAAAGSMSGYSRDRFPHWRSDGGRGCDVRDTVLRRDGTDIAVKDGCNVTGGRWYSVYDDQVFTEVLKVDIDHMVPLANAWRSGADKWDDKKRGDFANDLERPQLFAVSASSNRAKGDQDPAQWRPPNRDYWCDYAQDWITVKHHWQLTITAAEKTALSEMLGTCPKNAQQTSPPAQAG